ncbi:unnamed protein product [Symbiodinium sp. KB8]|nr:unnamed protein product [Symbiodinium sp. KB8]
MGGVLPRVCHAASLLVTRGVVGQTAAVNSVQQHAQLLPCASNFQQCITACGVAEFQALYEWLLASPQQAEDVDVIAAGQAADPRTSEQRTPLELSTFQLLRDVGLSVLGSTLDYLTLCQHSDARCGEVVEQFRSVQAMGEVLDERMRSLAKEYLPETGVRSPLLRVGHSVRSDLQAFLRQLPGLSAGLAATELGARLAQTVGQRARMLSWHLGMHAWVRGLRVPGRGAPVLILHEEYMSFQDMISAVVGTMVRNGQSQMALVEVGVPLEDWYALAAVRDFPGVQYAGIMAEPDQPSEIEGRAFIFEQRRAELQTSLGDRGVLYLASLQRAADAFPSRSMDMALVDFRGRSADDAQEQMTLWESKVKPGGVLLGVGFWPASPEIILTSETASLLPDFHFQSEEEDHHSLGLALGSSYRAAVRARLASHDVAIDQLLNSSRCQQLFQELLANHEKHVPELVEELRGIASGANVSNERLFAMSLQEELAYCQETLTATPRVVDHCTDSMLCNSQYCFDAHNEDGDLADKWLFAAFVQFGKSNFTVLNYAGDLLGGMSAFAFNKQGIAFSLNWVGPGDCDPAGLGRNFISRQLLTAGGWDEAQRIISQRHAAGHNYQLMDFKSRRIANFEVAHDQVSEVAIGNAFFHVNQYQTLSVPDQMVGNSSLHRLARLRMLPEPQMPQDALKILGDQRDRSYPIFHDEHSHVKGDLSDWTLATVLFDLDQGTVDLMAGNPKELHLQRRFRLSMPPQPAHAVVV